MGTLVQSFVENSEKRLQELQPAIDEAQEIREALTALGHSITKNNKRGGTRRSRRNGGRRQEFLTVVAENPGITVADAAKKMKVNPNYLYRLAGDASKDGMVRKDGKGYHPVAQAQSSATQQEQDGENSGNGGGSDE